MKKTYLILAGLMLYMITLYSQADSTTVKVDDNTLTVVKDKDSTRVIVDNNTISNVEHKKDTTRLRIGNKMVIITKTANGTVINIKTKGQNDTVSDIKNDDFEDNGYEDNNKNNYDKHHRFKGQYAGIELALNNFADNNFSIVRNSSNSFMNIRTSRSLDFNINVFQHSFGIVSDKFGAVTGLGLELCNYYFENNNTLGKDINGNTIGYYYNLKDTAIEKSKLATVFLTIPIIFEIKFNDGINFSAGIIGALKLGDHTKVIYTANGNEKTAKNYDDFNLNPFRYGVTARVGYHSLLVFANYYLTPLFESNKGPLLYPIAIGLALEFE